MLSDVFSKPPRVLFCLALHKTQKSGKFSFFASPPPNLFINNLKCWFFVLFNSLPPSYHAIHETMPMKNLKEKFRGYFIKANLIFFLPSTLDSFKNLMILLPFSSSTSSSSSSQREETREHVGVYLMIQHKCLTEKGYRWG